MGVTARTVATPTICRTSRCQVAFMAPVVGPTQFPRDHLHGSTAKA